ncbi:uncharacterized protein LOC107435028 [Ziziphus jujuba]|uniref:Uncharacterized protein LOC107435028 n=1 Tax=Ziziphus jujuba TaxID=326968 RepID=A0ABM3ZWR1_ZIZJJ|nr:uncharacterized protein LOC107435028 [Ziziphus jujuba]
MDGELYNAAIDGLRDHNLFGNVDNIRSRFQNNTILHIAAKSGKLRQLEEDDYLVHFFYGQNNEGNTSLHIAAKLGHLETVRILVKMARKTDVEQNKSLLTVENNKKDTALHEAVRYNHSEVVKLLIEEDPDLALIINGEGDSPLFMVVDRPFNQVALHILNTAPKCSDQRRNCMKVSHIAAIRSKRFITRSKIYPPEHLGRTPAKVLEKLQALTLEEEVFGWTPLHYAAHIRNDVLVRRILNKESKSLPFSRNKEAPHIAVESRKVMAVKFLLEQAMTFQDLIDLQDKKGNIALHVAATVGDFHIIRIFINDSRVDRGATNKDKRTFVDIILSNKELQDIDILKIMVDLKIEIVLPPLFEQKVDTRKTNEAESKEKKKDEIQIEEDEAGCKQKTIEAESKEKKEVEILDT